MTDCRIASQAHQYQIQTFSPVKPENKTLADEVKAYLADGGSITLIDNRNQVVLHNFYDKFIFELAQIAKDKKRKSFHYFCKKHGHVRHSAKDMLCNSCRKEQSNEARLKAIVERFCGGNT